MYTVNFSEKTDEYGKFNLFVKMVVLATKSCRDFAFSFNTEQERESAKTLLSTATNDKPAMQSALSSLRQFSF